MPAPSHAYLIKLMAAGSPPAPAAIQRADPPLLPDGGGARHWQVLAAPALGVCPAPRRADAGNAGRDA